MTVDRIAIRLITYCSLAIAAVIGTRSAPCVGATQTITTTYQYNADGARTAVTTQVDSEPATTIYLTWDNFTPDAAAPTTGTISAADGNLVGIGPNPGTTGRTTQFAYDVRDRLTECTAGPRAASYAYHPASLMSSSTLTSGDALQFYYDNRTTPLMVNTLQPSTGMASSFLGPVRYVSDGSEQVLLLPRKDTSGVYDPSAQTLSSYSYDPYGAQSSASATSSSGLSHDGTSYDLTQNPFQYTGEYHDPTCKTYYLRARWYLPALETFLSRDVGDRLHRYSYTAGNPVGRTDPSGLKFTGVDFSRGVDKAVAKLEPGAWKFVEPLLPVWGQVLGGIELLGVLPTFWHHPTAEGYVNFGLLSASILFEAGAETRSFDRLVGSTATAFRWRLGGDVAFGASQTAAQSYRHRRLDVPNLIEGIETTFMGMAYARRTVGIGYRPFDMSSEDVANSLKPQFEAAKANHQDVMLVYRVSADPSRMGVSGLPVRCSSRYTPAGIMNRSSRSAGSGRLQTRSLTDATKSTPVGSRFRGAPLGIGSEPARNSKRSTPPRRAITGSPELCVTPRGRR